jgi:hypothetical protein
LRIKFNSIIPWFLFLIFSLVINPGANAHPNLLRDNQPDFAISKTTQLKTHEFQLSMSIPTKGLAANGDTTYINNYTVWSNTTIGTKDILVVNDTLIVEGDLDFNTDAELIINTGAVCIIYGNLNLNNKVNLNIGAYLIVGGNLTAKPNSGMIVATIDASASVYILGDVATNQISGVNCLTPETYVPQVSSTECNFGNIISMEDNENDSTGIYDLFVSGDTDKGVSPVYTELCGGASVSISTLDTSAVFYQWCDSIGIHLAGENSYKFTTANPGEYFAKIVTTDGDTVISHRAKVVASSLNANFISEDDTCSLGTGAILFSNATGGSGNYEYSIDGGISWQTSQSFTDLNQDTFDIRIRDSLSPACELILDAAYILSGDTQAPTISCPANITVNPDDSENGTCTASGISLGTPLSNDNCGIASLTNDAIEPFVLGNTVVSWTATDNAGLTASCSQTVTVVPLETIDILVGELVNTCQSGLTGTQSTIIWDVTKLTGTTNWTYDFTINDGTTDVDSGNNITANGDIQITYIMNNTSGQDKDYTLSLFNVKDNCDEEEVSTSNNTNTITLFGLPATGEITTDY